MRQPSPSHGFSPWRRYGPGARPEQVGEDGQPFRLLPETQDEHQNDDGPEVDDDF